MAPSLTFSSQIKCHLRAAIPDLYFKAFFFPRHYYLSRFVSSTVFTTLKIFIVVSTVSKCVKAPLLKASVKGLRRDSRLSGSPTWQLENELSSTPLHLLCQAWRNLSQNVIPFSLTPYLCFIFLTVLNTKIT